MTELDLKKYFPRTTSIEAVRVTEENMEVVADWCGGKILKMASKDKSGEEETQDYVKIFATYRSFNPRQTQGFVGDWCVLQGTRFIFLTNANFNSKYTDDPEGIPLGVQQVFENVSTSIYDQMIAEMEEAKKKAAGKIVVVKVGPNTASINTGSIPHASDNPGDVIAEENVDA